MNRCLQVADLPEYMTKWKIPSKNRPKQLQTNNVPTYDAEILTTQIREGIYNSLMSHRPFLEEQKGCCKWIRGGGELLYIDQHILNESTTRRKNLAMT